MNDVIQAACEAYMLEQWAEFNRLVARLDENGKRRLIRALYVP